MSKQHEVKTQQKLLDANGNIAEPGYAKTAVWEYDRADIKAPSLRIKEWDYYLITNNDYALAMTVCDNNYLGLLSVSLMDYTRKTFHTQTKIKLFTGNKSGHSFDAESCDIEIGYKGIQISCEKTTRGRKLRCSVNNFKDKQPLTANFDLFDIPKESMVIATPFDQPKHFYYNQKINCIKARGQVKIGEKIILFDEGVSTAVLDWGRGVWPRENVWFWGTASGYAEGVPFGFNLGYGFGNTSAATENMVFYDGKAHKLEHIDFGIPVKEDGTFDLMKDWHCTSSDNRIEFEFKPMLDRRSKDSALGIVKSDQHQVFGRAKGFAILDDGKKVEFANLIASCEVVKNKW